MELGHGRQGHTKVGSEMGNPSVGEKDIEVCLFNVECSYPHKEGS